MQGYLLFRTVHNLLRAVLISNKSEDFLLPANGWTFPGRIFQKSFDVDEMGETPFHWIFSGLAQLLSPAVWPHVHARSLWKSHLKSIDGSAPTPAAEHTQWPNL